jgi:DNA polymerase elongation subunit (family B)
MYPSLIVKYNISAETVDACEDLKTEIYKKYGRISLSYKVFREGRRNEG